MNILAIIPARGGSKGIPGKNIKLLNGKPLLQYTFEIAKQSLYFSKLILSSEDEMIINVAHNIGLEVPFIRPKFLATNQTPTIEVVKHTLQFYKNQDIYFDAVCILQVTSPFRSIDFLNTAINKFIISNCDSLISIQKVPHIYNPHWVFEENEQGNLKISTGDKSLISRRQDLPLAFHRDGSIYITKSDIILNQNSLYGNTITYIETPKEFYVNIDTMEDWVKAEDMICSNPKLKV